MSSNQIQIQTTGRDEDLLLPYCPPTVYEDLKKNFSLDVLMGTHHLSNNDEHIGYIKGVMDVLNRVKTLAKYNNDEE